MSEIVGAATGVPPLQSLGRFAVLLRSEDIERRTYTAGAKCGSDGDRVLTSSQAARSRGNNKRR